MDYKIISIILATIIGTASFVPYLKDIFKKKTKPHLYTWLVWSITQGTAVAGIIYGGGGIGAIELIIGTILVFLVFLFSLKYGSKNITKADTFVLFAALLAILVWWKLKNPLTAIFIVSLIDLLGCIPSFRKTFIEPWSETVLTWFGFALSNCFAILALHEYNFLTLTYITSLTIANLGLGILCLIRRPFVLKPR